MADYPGTKPNVLGSSEVYAVAIKAGFTPSQAVVMVAIAVPESGFDANAFNDDAATGDYSIGLWQINLYGSLRGRLKAWGLSDEKQLLDPLTNAKAARSVFSGQGFQAWSTYKSGAYAPNLPEGQAAASATTPGQIDSLVGSAEQDHQPGPAPTDTGNQNLGVLFGEAGAALVPGLSTSQIQSAGDFGGSVYDTASGALSFVGQLGKLGLSRLLKLAFALILGGFGFYLLFHKQIDSAGKAALL